MARGEILARSEIFLPFKIVGRSQCAQGFVPVPWKFDVSPATAFCKSSWLVLQCLVCVILLSSTSYVCTVKIHGMKLLSIRQRWCSNNISVVWTVPIPRAQGLSRRPWCCTAHYSTAIHVILVYYACSIHATHLAQ